MTAPRRHELLPPPSGLDRLVLTQPRIRGVQTRCLTTPRLNRIALLYLGQPVIAFCGTKANTAKP